MVLPLHSVFEEIALLLLAAIAAGVIANGLRQPLIIAFIIVGLVAGPVGLDIIKSTEDLMVLAEMGLTLLLFVVGLKLDPQLIRNMGGVSLTVGLGQIIVTGVAGFALSTALGMPWLTALYVGSALTFSSTILIVKLLSDKRDTDSLYGRLSLGYLIVDDIVIVLLMIALSPFSAESTPSLAVLASLLVLKGGGLLLGVVLIVRYVFPRFLPLVSRSTELMVLFGITWALALAAVSELLGFSKEVGAFIAGMSLASTIYRDLLTTKLVGLRDFLLLFYFVALGSRLNLEAAGSQMLAAVLLSLVVLIGKPLVVMLILGRLGYRKRTAFMGGLTVAQISEFSLILMALGITVGHVGEDALSLVTLVLVITMGVDAHLILHAQGLYERFGKHLRFLDHLKPFREDEHFAGSSDLQESNVILIGMGRYGSKIFKQLSAAGRAPLGVDFDPVAVRAWRSEGADVVLADAEDLDFAHSLPLSKARWVISSIRDNHLNNGIMSVLRHEGYKGLFACAAEESTTGSEVPIHEGVDLLFNPFEDSAVQATDLIFATEEEISRKAMENTISKMTDHYIICGFGRMGKQIVKDLANFNVPCVVVEWNPEQFPLLREDNIPFVEGKASDDAVLVRAGIQRAKGLISVAPTDEENVFITLTAKDLNPNLFVVARSIRTQNEDKLKHAGADMVMSPYVLGGRRMAAAVIRPEVMDFLDLVVHDDGVETEMAKITVGASCGCRGRTLKDINLWERCRVTLLGLRRKGEDLHANPGPDLTVMEGDELIVMGTPAQIATAKEFLLSSRFEG